MCYVKWVGDLFGVILPPNGSNMNYYSFKCVQNPIEKDSDKIYNIYSAKGLLHGFKAKKIIFLNKARL